MEIILDQKRASVRLRAHRLDNRHPVSRRLFRSQSFPVNTRLTRNVWPLLEEIEQMDPLLYPPWQSRKPSTIPNICSVWDKADAAFQQWANTCPPLECHLGRVGTKIYFSFSFPIPAGLGQEFLTILKVQITCLIRQILFLIQWVDPKIMLIALALHF